MIKEKERTYKSKKYHFENVRGIQPLSQSEMWVKTLFFWLPRYLATGKPPEDPAEKSMGVYVTYKQIFGGIDSEQNSEENLCKEILKFNFIDLLQGLAKLNFLLSENYLRPKSEDEVGLVKQLFSGIPLQKLLNLRKSGRKLFSRQQILALIKINLLKNTSTVEGKKLIGQDLNSFGKLLFRITDFLEKDTEEREHKCKIPEEKKRILIGCFIRNLEFNASQQFRYTLPRYWTIFFDCFCRAKRKHPNEAFDLVRSFKKFTGIELELFLFLGFGIHAFYSRVYKEKLISKPAEFLLGPSFFSNLNAKTRKKAKHIFSTISMDKEKFKELFDIDDKGRKGFYFAFQSIWRKPFYKINNDAFFPLDISYFQEKMTQGAYWIVFDELLRTERISPPSKRSLIARERNRLTAFFGRGIEIYVNDLFHRIYDAGPKRLFSEIDGENTSGVDIIIYYPGILMFVEIAAFSVRHNTILSADLDQIEQEIKEIFFGGTQRRRKGKINQLDNAIEKFCSGELVLPNISPAEIRKIYPILVLPKGLPYFPPLFQKYRKYIKNKGLLRKFVNKFQILNLEDLEMLEPIIQSGKAFPVILEEYMNSDYQGWPFKNFLYFQKHASLRHNEYLMAQLKKFDQKARKFLFKTKLK